MAKAPWGCHVSDERLALHFLGQLGYAESDGSHAHLGRCALCLYRASETIGTVGGPDLLIDEPGLGF